MAQFPLSDLLTGLKRIYTSIKVQKSDGTYQDMNMDDNGGIKTAVVTPLPAGTNNLGQVDVNSFPAALISATGLKVDLQGASITISDVQAKTMDFAFQTNATVAGAGQLLTVDSYRDLTIEIVGTSTAQTVKFWGLMNSETKIPLTGFNVSTQSSATQTTGINEIWQFPITGLKTVEMEIISVSGGELSVNGKVVA